MILLPIIIEGITTRKDNTLSVRLGCNELSPNEAGQLMTLHGKYAFCAIKPEMFSQTDLEALEGLKSDTTIGKSPSERLRGVLYRNFEKNAEGYKNFTLYYDAKMDLIIEHYKGKLQ